MGVTVRVVPRVTQNDGGEEYRSFIYAISSGADRRAVGIEKSDGDCVGCDIAVERCEFCGNAQAAGVAVVGVSQRQAGIIVPVESWQSVAYCPGGHFGKPVGFRREVCLRVKFEHNRHLIGPSSGGDVDGAGPLKVVPTSCKKHGRQHKCCPPCRLI